MRLVPGCSAVVLLLSGCVPVLGDYEVGPDDASAGSGLDPNIPDASNPAPTPTQEASSGCTNDSECPALATTPAGCAVAQCDKAHGVCSYRANDNDNDGHGTALCAATTPTSSFIRGDDCDDKDHDLFPGHPRACAALPDGTPIPFPGGAPKGECRAGQQECTADGNIGACTGAIAPRKEDCGTEAKDEDCDGSPVNGCPCSPPNATRNCAEHLGKDGVGICRAGAQTCGTGGWSNCTGYVDPKIRDCSSTQDNDCDGRVDSSIDTQCRCAPGSTQACNQHPGKDGVGTCRAGSQTCALHNPPSTSDYGPCAGSVDPAVDDCEAAGRDSDCDGVRGNGSSCTKLVHVYVKPAYQCAIRETVLPEDIYLTDEEERTRIPLEYVRLTSFRVFQAASGSKVPIHRCLNSDTRLSGYHFVGLSGCATSTMQRLLGYVSTANGGNGWVALAEFLGQKSASTGVMRSDAPECCRANCNPTAYYVLQ